MKVQNPSAWVTSIQSGIQNVISSTRQRGTFAQYHSETNMFYFFDRGKENPSVAKIIVNDEINKSDFFARARFFTRYYSRRFASEKSAFENSFTKLYPNTGDLRNQLINNNRFSMDKVKPKASALKKFLRYCKL